jgi:uncharacterized membrane protein
MSEKFIMHKNRLEAFSDGVLAIIITIMVLELKVPHEATFEALMPLIPIFFSYVLSFIYIGIYWHNHHHLFHVVKQVDGKILWANSHLLFWLSLLPFVTAWSGENHFAQNTVAVYGLVLMLCGAAYFILTRALLSSHGAESELARALGRDFKGKISVVLYIIGIALSFWSSLAAMLVYVAVAAIWFVPDQRIEKNFNR